MSLNIAHTRLQQHKLIAPTFTRPAEAVAWLGAVQAQDYAAAKWALGLRLHGATDSALERAFAAGEILRTHVLRPTWHFVTPADIGWLLALTAPHVHARNAYMYRQQGLDNATCKRSHAVLAKALQGGQQRTRDELRAVLEQAQIATDNGVRLSYLLMWAELAGLICSGARRGKQFTYALLAERAPQAQTLARPAALAELARRFFRSRGPATVQDFAHWSGLTVADARQGLAAVAAQFQSEQIAGQIYWFPAPPPAAKATAPVIHLLPVYDEYISGYKDRSALTAAGTAVDPFDNLVLLNGQIVGTWQRTLHKQTVTVTPHLTQPLPPEAQTALATAVHHYGQFLGLTGVLESVS